MGVLSFLLWIPAVGLVLLTLIPGRYDGLIRSAANFFTTVVCLISFWLAFMFNPSNSELQFNEYFPVNPVSGSAYALGVDGLSMPMVVLASLLISVALLISTAITSNVKSYYICMMLLEFGMMGVFLAQDWALFYIFWEVTLITVYFLIGHWGGKDNHSASINFVFYTIGGSIFMLLSLLSVSQSGLEHSGSLMTSMHQAAQGMLQQQQILVLLGFLIGFGVILPIFPLHGWLALVQVEAPNPVSILLSGILLKMGAYGLLRAVEMLPEAALDIQSLLIFLAFFSMIYGGLLAWRQSNLKVMGAYASISNMGLVLLGISTLTETGLTGAVLQMTAHGLVAGALFLLIGVLSERKHTCNFQDFSSLIRVMPRFAFFMTVTLLAAMGLPGSPVFIAELHTVIGGFQQWGWLWVFFSLSFLINAAYALRAIVLLFTGPEKPQTPQTHDLSSSELLAAGIVVAAILLFGLWPEPMIDLSSATISRLNTMVMMRNL